MSKGQNLLDTAQQVQHNAARHSVSNTARHSTVSCAQLCVAQHSTAWYGSSAHRPAVISEGADQGLEDSVQVWQDGIWLHLLHKLSHAVACCLPASVVVRAGLRLIVLQHLHTLGKLALWHLRYERTPTLYGWRYSYTVWMNALLH